MGRAGAQPGSFTKMDLGRGLRSPKRPENLASTQFTRFAQAGLERRTCELAVRGSTRSGLAEADLRRPHHASVFRRLFGNDRNRLRDAGATGRQADGGSAGAEMIFSWSPLFI